MKHVTPWLATLLLLAGQALAEGQSAPLLRMPETSTQPTTSQPYARPAQTPAGRSGLAPLLPAPRSAPAKDLPLESLQQQLRRNQQGGDERRNPGASETRKID